jgi:serine-type D-Ala-D-Ala carboxypeptidase (penicillin-binding protein 5/6)
MQPRRVYSSAGRRRRALGRVAVAAVVLLALALAWIRIGDSTPRPVRQVAQAPDAGNHVHLTWPREGEAAVAVEGLGTFAAGSETPAPIASVAKVMTAYLVLKEDPLEPGREGFTIEITEADVEEFRQRLDSNQSVVAVQAGEMLSERQALEALLLPSANNVAALLAVHQAGSVEAFVSEMNEAAAELGMGKTHYTDPSGFEDTTVSTAADQLKLGRAAMADPTFAQIVAMPSTVLPVAGEVANFNELVGHEGFVGIKTGSDDAAGGCLLFARRIDVGGGTRTVLGAILGQRDGDLIQAALAGAKDLAASAAAAARDQSGQIARHGPRHGLGPVADPELSEQVLEVLVDGARADREELGDLTVAAPAGDPGEHLGLAHRQAERPQLGRGGAVAPLVQHDRPPRSRAVALDQADREASPLGVFE